MDHGRAHFRRVVNPLRTIGSVSLVRSLLAHGLVDCLRFMIFPLARRHLRRERLFSQGDIARFDRLQTTIGRLIIEPERHGQGLGSALLHAIEAACPTAKRFELFTGSQSKAISACIGDTAMKSRKPSSSRSWSHSYS